MPPLGCHTYFDEELGQWEVTLFASRTEIIGGPEDGTLCDATFAVDLRDLLPLLDDVESFYWQANPLGDEDELGPHVAIEGAYRGQPVWLRIVAIAPDRFEAGRHVRIHERRIEDLW
jgi:hypothetical protein